MQYHRPTEIEQAVELLKTARPLGGGTALTPDRRNVAAVIDLQGLDLGGFTVEPDSIRFGAGVRLQELVERAAELPAALVDAVRLEAAWNMRNAATLAGVVVSSDGRSPLLTVLAALGAVLELEPGGEQVRLQQFFDRRRSGKEAYLITSISVSAPAGLAYQGVARSPADRPLVCASAARDAEGTVDIALGGFGEHPVHLGHFRPADPELAGEAASEAYAGAGDGFASAAYRAAIAAVLARRVLAEVAA